MASPLVLFIGRFGVEAEEMLLGELGKKTIPTLADLAEAFGLTRSITALEFSRLLEWVEAREDADLLLGHFLRNATASQRARYKAASYSEQYGRLFGDLARRLRVIRDLRQIGVVNQLRLREKVLKKLSEKTRRSATVVQDSLEAFRSLAYHEVRGYLEELVTDGYVDREHGRKGTMYLRVPEKELAARLDERRREKENNLRRARQFEHNKKIALKVSAQLGCGDIMASADAVQLTPAQFERIATLLGCYAAGDDPKPADAAKSSVESFADRMKRMRETGANKPRKVPS